jgi:two-component system, LytTR family, response regulator
MKAIIIDDEAKARRIMRMFLQEYCPTVEVVAEVESVSEGVKAIQKHQPDVVFLDIEMPGYNGFQLLDFFETIDFEIVFATAYSEYAIKAFQVSAIDYLLKPIQIDQLIAAVQKVEHSRAMNTIQQRLATLQANMSERRIQRIILPLSDGSLFIDLKDIICLKAEGSYVQFYLADGNKILVSKNLKEYEEQLTTAEGFFRTHRSYLVNTHHVQRVNSDGAILLTRDLLAALSREKRSAFELFLRATA